MTSTFSSTTPSGATVYRVMVVDDAAVIRSVTAQILNSDPALKVVSMAADGQIAIDLLNREPVDVIVLDIEMPVMDGLAALTRLKAIDPAVQIIMSSTLTQANAEISLQALARGATDYISKPSNVQGLDAAMFKQELITKVKVLGGMARHKGVRTVPGTAITSKKTVVPSKVFTLHKQPIFRPDAIAIGSSTGGPQALFTTISKMGNALPQPILITQHMPAEFTATLAQHITRNCRVDCTQAANGDVLKPSHYYVAAGDYHMLTIRDHNQTVVRLVKEPPENFCRPAVDPMLRSMVRIYGKRILVIILTGMGQDGLLGSTEVVRSGGTVIAQNEESSVVWGMPGAVATAGLCSAVLPIDEIGKYAQQIALQTGP